MRGELSDEESATQSKLKESIAGRETGRGHEMGRSSVCVKDWVMSVATVQRVREREWYDTRRTSRSSTVRPALRSPLAARKNFTQHGSGDTVFLLKPQTAFQYT